MRDRSRTGHKLAAARVAITAASGEPLTGVRVSTVILQRGAFRRHPIRLRPTTRVFRLRMPVGRQIVFASASDFYEQGATIQFRTDAEPTFRFALRPKHEPAFPDAYSPKVQRIIDESDLPRLGHVRRAAMLNILAKMGRVRVGSQRVIEYVERIDHAFQDRLYVRCDKDLLPAVQSARTFAPALGALHPGFDSASFKTTDEKGGLQLSFAAGGRRVDADIDLYRDLFLHFFGEVFWNHLSGVKTDPFHVYQLLVRDGIQPEYRLRPKRAR